MGRELPSTRCNTADYSAGYFDALSGRTISSPENKDYMSGYTAGQAARGILIKENNTPAHNIRPRTLAS